MELRQLRYFVAIADHLHFGRAAETLGLAQSALSMQLQTLEKALDVKLVARTKRSVALTAAGEVFLIEARATLEQAERAELVARRAGRGELGSLEIGYVISAACSGIIQTILSAYRDTHAGVRIALHELESPLQIQRLEEGKLDCCIVRTSIGDVDAFDRLVLSRESIILALASTHRLAKKEKIAAADLIDEQFIAPQFYNESGFAKHLVAIGKKAGFTPHIDYPTRDFVTALALAAAGLGVATVPDSVRAIQLPGLVYRPLSDVDESSELFMVFRRHESSPLITALKSIAETLAKKPTHQKR